MLHIFIYCLVAEYVWKLFEAVISVTTTHRICADPKLILLMNWEPESLRKASKLIRKYINILALIYKKTLYNIYYSNLNRVSKTDVAQLITESTCLIQVYTNACYKFMNANGHRRLTTWI